MDLEESVIHGSKTTYLVESNILPWATHAHPQRI